MRVGCKCGEKTEVDWAGGPMEYYVQMSSSFSTGKTRYRSHPKTASVRTGALWNGAPMAHGIIAATIHSTCFAVLHLDFEICSLFITGALT